MLEALYLLVAFIVGPIVTRIVVVKLCEEDSIRDCEDLMDKFMAVFCGMVVALFWLPIGVILAAGFICYFLFGLLPEYIIRFVTRKATHEDV